MFWPRFAAPVSRRGLWSVFAAVWPAEEGHDVGEHCGVGDHDWEALRGACLLDPPLHYRGIYGRGGAGTV